MVSYGYDTYREIMNKELITMCKLLDELEKSIEERKSKDDNVKRRKTENK